MSDVLFCLTNSQKTRYSFYCRGLKKKPQQNIHISEAGISTFWRFVLTFAINLLSVVYRPTISALDYIDTLLHMLADANTNTNK